MQNKAPAKSSQAAPEQTGTQIRSGDRQAHGKRPERQTQATDEENLQQPGAVIIAQDQKSRKKTKCGCRKINK